MNPTSIESWASAFRDGVVPSDVDETLVKAFLHHLADLGFFRVEGERWTANDIDGDFTADRWRAELLQRLDVLSATERGFVAHFFLGHKSGFPPHFPDELHLDASSAKEPPAKPALPGRAADLSNLQIVKKLGRQMQPFIELEKNFLARLAGPFTCTEDARKIFNYVLGKTHLKTTPMKWEQLGRRRHK